MKETDLMIGDWISYIPEIAEGEDSYLGEPHNIQVDLSCLQKVDELIFVSIPLTPEILEKNGFIKVNSQRYDYGYPDTNCYVKVNPKKNMIHVNGRNANSNLYSHSFVHELQRALRLCGLNELADNFKV